MEQTYVPAPTEKRCNKCGVVKDVDQFHKNTRARDGLQRLCTQCKGDYDKARYDKNPKLFNALTNACRVARHRATPAASRIKLMVGGAVARSRKPGGRACHITPADVYMGDTCPCCSRPFNLLGSAGARSTSPSLDRVDNNLGYIPGNVWVICHQCNQRKSNATSAELRTLADAIDRQRGVLNV